MAPVAPISIARRPGNRAEKDSRDEEDRVSLLRALVSCAGPVYLFARRRFSHTASLLAAAGLLDLSLVAGDPDLVAAVGFTFRRSPAINALREQVLPLADLVTPNLPETATLIGEPTAETENAAVAQGRRLLAIGARAVLVKGGHGEGSESTDYLVSAEGARSIARKELNLEFEGFTYPERTINIEVAYDFRRHGYTERNYISDPVEYSNLFHWKGPPDRWRIHFPTNIDDDENELKRPEALQKRLQQFLGIDHEFEICGCNLYTVHQRVAAKFRVGRVVLAGDSAHVNSPIGGMGLNSGVHDAFNLADKLARILHGTADDAELDRYERQRRHVAVQHTQAGTIRNKRLLEERDPAVRKRNHDELRRQAEDPTLARKFLLRTALFDSLREAERIL